MRSRQLATKPQPSHSSTVQWRELRCSDSSELRQRKTELHDGVTHSHCLRLAFPFPDLNPWIYLTDVYTNFYVQILSTPANL